MATASFCGYSLRFCSVVTVIEATMHEVAAEYPHSTLKGTPTCSNHSGTALHETSVASQEESGCVCCFL